MKEGPDISYIASLIGDPARANILTALMSGKALTATELSAEAGVTLQTTSAHLTKLVEGGLLRVRKQGRHKYFTLSNDDIANVLEALMGLASNAGYLRHRSGPKNQAMRKARVCYNHLAGDMGVHLFESMISKGQLIIKNDAISLTEDGITFSANLGVDINQLNKQKAPLCRECLDWSARRSHLAGGLGRAFLSKFLEKKWAKRLPNSRVIQFSTIGEKEFYSTFKL